MSKKTTRVTVGLIAMAGVALLAALPGRAENRRASVTVKNWQAPGTWTSMVTLADQSGPMPFVPITPCRVADTRAGFGFTGAYGPPSIGAGSSRTFDIAASGCAGIPANAAAFSFNLTVTNTAGPGFIQAYPAGGSAGGSSAVNYTGSGQTVANAAVTPAGTGGNAGKITITAGVSTTDVIIDINGYYSGASSSGQGMTLTTTGVYAGLTVNHVGSGRGITLNTNTSSFSLYSTNHASNCFGTCGGYFGISSTAAGTVSLTGVAGAETNRSIGVFGQSYGTGASDLTSQYAAGVYGEAANTSTPGGAYSAGVMGLSRSTNAFAAGVYGEVTGSSANAGYFQNLGAATTVRTYLAYNAGAGGTTPIGINTNGQIYGTNGLQIAGTKNFVTPHPEDPSKEIAYVALEGPTADVFFRGTARLKDGVAVIAVPDHFRLVAREGSYMTTVTPVGAAGSLWVESEGPAGIVVRGAANVAFHYVVWGERDEYRDQVAVRANTHFNPEMLEKTGALPMFPESTRAILVKNGTLNPDSSYNRDTAQRLGWNVPEPRPESVEAPPVVDHGKK